MENKIQAQIECEKLKIKIYNELLKLLFEPINKNKST